MSKKKEKNRFSILRTIMHILGGDILKDDFIVKHTKMIVLVVLLLFFYISNRYTCITKLREIDRLQKQLIEVKSEALDLSAELTSNTRPSQVEELIKRQGLGLEKAKTPPYRLNK